MEIVIGPTESNWGRPGRRPQDVPDQVKAALDATYNTGQCGTILIENDDDREEAREFVNLARTYARQKKVRAVFQPRDPRNAGNTLKFQLRDKVDDD